MEGPDIKLFEDVEWTSYCEVLNRHAMSIPIYSTSSVCIPYGYTTIYLICGTAYRASILELQGSIPLLSDQF